MFTEFKEKLETKTIKRFPMNDSCLREFVFTVEKLLWNSPCTYIDKSKSKTPFAHFTLEVHYAHTMIKEN